MGSTSTQVVARKRKSPPSSWSSHYLSSLSHVFPTDRPRLSSSPRVVVPRTQPSSSSSSRVVIPDSQPSSSSLSPFVVPPSMRRTGQFVVGSKEKKACADPGADTVVIRDGDCWSCCDICMDTKHAFEMINISDGCSHSFCATCVTMHVETKIAENIANVKCPGIGCGNTIEVGICKGFLKRESLERWERMRCEAAIAELQKYYCPFKDCSRMLIMDGEAGNPLSLRECECPYCHRLFCASCRVPWNWKYTCEQFQSMDANE